MDEMNVWEDNLFNIIQLPNVSEIHYLERRLDHRVILLTKNGCRVDALETELTKSMKNYKLDTEFEINSLGEIFAVSWAPGIRENIGMKSPGENLAKAEVAGFEGGILKVSELLKWKESYDKLFTQYRSEKTCSGEKNLKMDEETMIRRKFVEKKSKEFANPTNKMIRIIDLDDLENPDIQFRNLCETARTYTIHWLQAFREGFIWKLTNHWCRKFTRFNLSEISYDEANWLSHMEHKAFHRVICICGIAGMGKTTFMKQIAHRLKARYDKSLVCFIDLMSFGKMIDDKQVKSLKLETFSELLAAYYLVESHSEVIKTMLTSQREPTQGPIIELLMDGLDNMTDTSRSILTELFKHDTSLHFKLTYRVWFTTRPHLKSEIEEGFGIVAYNLDSLNITDVKEYLHECNEKTNFAVDLFSCLTHVYSNLGLGGLLGTPQNIVAFQDYMRVNDNLDPHNLNGYTIMRVIILKSFIRSYTNKYVDLELEADTEVFFSKALCSYVPVAIREYSGETLRHTKTVKLATELNSDDQNNMLRFGIVSKNEHGEFYFVHAAYAAFILAEHFRFNKPDWGFQSDFFLKHILAKDECDMIRQFYNESLSTPVPTSVSTAWMSLIRQFLINSYLLSYELDNHSGLLRTTNLLQLAIIDQRITLAKLILRCFSPSNTEECRRLIRRKVVAKIITTKQFPKARHSSAKSRNDTKKRKYLELSALSLAIIFGDRELVHSMYTILGRSEKTSPHLEQWGFKDDFHFSPLQLALLGGNWETLEYLQNVQQKCTKKTETRNYQNHLLFYRQWIIKFPNLRVGKNLAEPAVLREVHGLKFQGDIPNIDHDPGVNFDCTANTSRKKAKPC